MTIYTCDFEYDGVKLSDLGYIVCEFDGNGGVDTVNTGSEITFITVPMHDGKRYAVTGSKYDKCLSTSFQICKDPETHMENEMAITDEEFRYLSRWLNRREYLWFNSFDSEATTRPWFRASFTLTRVDVGNTTYGVELNMTTDAPFGYGEEETVSLNFRSGSLTKTFNDENDEIGDTFPDMTITCMSGGTLTLTDSVTGCSMQIKNCVNGEVLTISGNAMILSTSSATHEATLANDFNYDFFRFGNTFASRANSVTASIPCDVVITYRPIIKDTL